MSLQKKKKKKEKERKKGRNISLKNEKGKEKKKRGKTIVQQEGKIDPREWNEGRNGKGKDPWKEEGKRSEQSRVGENF